LDFGLPPDIRDRTPAPHALRVGLRRAEMPSAAELAAFCSLESKGEESAGWMRLAVPPGRDMLLVFLQEGRGPVERGFEHALVVESGFSKACFLAAYFIARRCGGVVQVRQRAAILPAAAFAERYLDDEDLDSRWSRAIPDS
jgi:hypothetical protein